MPSNTVRVNVIVPEEDGATKVGLCESGFLSIVWSPDVRAQRYVIVPPSGSEEREPSSVTVSPNATFWSCPACAIGAIGPLVTVMVTVSVAEFVPSDTVSVMIIFPVVVGAVNVGFCVMGLVSETDEPDVRSQEYERESPFGSVPEPLRVTVAPGATV